MLLAERLKKLFFKDTATKPSDGCIENLSNAPTDDAVQEVFEKVKGYKEYVTSFIGANGSIGTPVVYRNEVAPADATIARSAEGIYTITFATEVLTASLTTAHTQCPTDAHVLGTAHTSTTVVTITSGTIADGTDDDVIGTVFVVIRVYDA